MHAVTHPVSSEKGRGPSNPGRCVTARADETTGERMQQRHESSNHPQKQRQLLVMITVAEKLSDVMCALYDTPIDECV